MTWKDRLNEWRDSKSLVWTVAGYVGKVFVEAIAAAIAASPLLLSALFFTNIHLRPEIGQQSAFAIWAGGTVLALRLGWCMTSY